MAQKILQADGTLKDVSQNDEEASKGKDAKGNENKDAVIKDQNLVDPDTIFNAHLNKKEVLDETKEKPAEQIKADDQKVDEKPQFKFKSQEEAEKAYRESEKLMHERAQEASELRRRETERYQRDRELEEKKPDPKVEFKKNLQDSFKKIDFYQDQETVSAQLAETISDAVENISNRTFNETNERQRQIEQVNREIETRLIGVGLKDYKDELFYPILDSKLANDPGFRQLTGDKQFEAVVSQMNVVLGKVRGSLEATKSDRESKGNALSSMGKGPTQIPLNTKSEGEDEPLGSFASDLKKLRQRQREASKAVF